RVGNRVLRPLRRVEPGEGDPVVVEDTLRAVGGVRGSEPGAGGEGGHDRVEEQPGIRMAEPVDAAVALVAGGRPLAVGGGTLRAEPLDLRAEVGEKPV